MQFSGRKSATVCDEVVRRSLACLSVQKWLVDVRPLLRENLTETDPLNSQTLIPNQY